jgi:hypothetical protein
MIIAGTVTFCHSGTGIHYWIRIQHKMGNSQKIVNERPTFWEIILLLTMIEKARFVKNFYVVGKPCLILSGSGTGAGTGTNTFPKSEPEQILRFHNTD